MGNAIHGFWTVKSHLMPDEDEIVYISASRFVHLTIVSEGPPPKRIAVRLWYERLENDAFLVTLDPTKEGWKISMWMDQLDLIIHNGTKEFRCQRVEDAELSDSAKTALTKANEKMDAIEANI
jgi:hypothetical protein